MPLIRGHHSFDDHYTQIPNDWVRDSRLSLKAIGLLAQIMSHKPGWNLSLRSIARINETGVGTIKSAVEELEQYGYLVRSKDQLHNDDGTFADYLWTTADPFQNPVTVKTAHGKQDTKKTITKKTILKESTNRASQIPDDFSVTEDMRIWAADKHPQVDIDKATLNFVDYWKSKPKDNKQLDWTRTWQRWIRTTRPEAKARVSREDENKKAIREFLKNAKD
jgi:hypothetical protein